MNGPVTLGFKSKRKNAKTGGDGQCWERQRWLSARVRSSSASLRREVKGSGSLLGVELVLQLHELPGSFDLVGDLLPLREEALALLKGQALGGVAGDGVLLLLAANPRTQP